MHVALMKAGSPAGGARNRGQSSRELHVEADINLLRQLPPGLRIGRVPGYTPDMHGGISCCADQHELALRQA